MNTTEKPLPPHYGPSPFVAIYKLWKRYEEAEKFIRQGFFLSARLTPELEREPAATADEPLIVESP